MYCIMWCIWREIKDHFGDCERTVMDLKAFFLNIGHALITFIFLPCTIFLLFFFWLGVSLAYIMCT
jgi:hypothetical protein